MNFNDEGGGQKSSKSCQRSLWMLPKKEFVVIHVHEGGGRLYENYSMLHSIKTIIIFRLKPGLTTAKMKDLL